MAWTLQETVDGNATMTDHNTFSELLDAAQAKYNLSANEVHEWTCGQAYFRRPTRDNIVGNPGEHNIELYYYEIM